MAAQPEANVTPDAIAQALDATLSPSIDNETRRQALQYLENVKSQPQAPTYAIVLAKDRSHSAAVRHYGLQILEHAIRYRWNDYGFDEAAQLRDWIIDIAEHVNNNDPQFLVTKIAQLWTDCAKRLWGEDWIDMDARLVSYWNDAPDDKNVALKALVLYIIESLAEDVCNREDPIAGLRSEILGNALNECIIPEQLYRRHLETRSKPKSTELRFGNVGWLARICDIIQSCAASTTTDVNIRRDVERIASKALDALRSIATWISLTAVLEVGCVEILFGTLQTSGPAIALSALEILGIIYSRPPNVHFQEVGGELLKQAFLPAHLTHLAKLYQSTNALSIDDDEQLGLQKRASELLAAISDDALTQPDLIDTFSGLPFFFEILVKAFESPSLVVSIPALHSWMKFLSARNKITPYVLKHLNVLIDICSERMINYESLPEDMDLLVLQLLYSDFDTMPERHAFLGNYRRYCVSVIENITRHRPQDALSYVTQQMMTVLRSSPQITDPTFEPAKYNRSSLTLLQFDARFNVVLSVLKGIVGWRTEAAAEIKQGAQNGHLSGAIEAALQMIHNWTYQIMDVKATDPEIALRIISLLSNVVRNILQDANLAKDVVRYALSSEISSENTEGAFSEAVREYHGHRVLELQKIALVFADTLLEDFFALEQQIQQLLRGDDGKQECGFRAFLFMIVQRTTKLDNDSRMSQMRTMLQPLVDAWQDQHLRQSCMSLDAFCNLLQLQDLPGFWTQHSFTKQSDWAAVELNATAQERQRLVKSAVEHLPLRLTKSMLGTTTEKLNEDSAAFDMACTLWEPHITLILPTLLNMIKQASAFNNLANWTHLPPELRDVIKRTLQDRFWQSGISNESRSEFYARICGSKTSYEGFASTVRGAMRNVREQGYHIIFLLTKFEEPFYGMAELPEHLAVCLFEDIDALSANHVQPVINLATGLVQKCPDHHQRTFIPPLLIRMFTKLDKKISTEWEAILQASQESGQADDLSEEMRGESVLRQLTYSMVCFVSIILQGTVTNPQNQQKSRPRLANLVLTNTAILEPVILFCTHALHIRDTRCCTMICKILGSILPMFASDDGPVSQVREFISTEVLKAGITSLNEPYFADMQKELGGLLAQIIDLYSAKTDTPRQVLLSLPNMQSSRVDAVITKIRSGRSARQQRAIVLDLLEGVRGVSIHESGKIVTRVDDKKTKSNVPAKYMEVETKPTITDGDEVGLDGLAGLFDQG